jgi:hypothetical protein
VWVREAAACGAAGVEKSRQYTSDGDGPSKACAEANRAPGRGVGAATSTLLVMAGPARGWAGVLVLLLAALAILAVAARGGFGPLVVCGVDGWAVCVAWPRAISMLVWLLFLGFVGLLGGWHVREWRASTIRPPRAAEPAAPAPSTVVATAPSPHLHMERVE